MMDKMDKSRIALNYGTGGVGMWTSKVISGSIFHCSRWRFKLQVKLLMLIHDGSYRATPGSFDVFLRSLRSSGKTAAVLPDRAVASQSKTKNAVRKIELKYIVLVMRKFKYDPQNLPNRSGVTLGSVAPALNSAPAPAGTFLMAIFGASRAQRNRKIILSPPCLSFLSAGR